MPTSVATYRLSSSRDALRGIRFSAVRHLTFTGGLSRITLAAYRPAPTRRHPVRALLRSERCKAIDRLRSSTRVRRPCGPGNPDRCSTTTESGYSDVGSPERPFGRNQLPGGSIGLSPLCPTLAIDLHIRTATILHRALTRLRSGQA